MDEFAFRKGCTYGTVLVDVEAGRVVDVLPDRTSETFAAWLKDHPGAEIICRDRATAYTKAIKEAAPMPWRSRTGGICCRTCPPQWRRPAISTATACVNTPNRRIRRRFRNQSRCRYRCRNCPAHRSSSGPATATRTSIVSWRSAGRSARSPDG
ncbi:transposase [Streptomyces sporangiiformans]|uniref:transposase n=1 Tax=Streptomyces sporangiiformans TaxID=2315329 RepID=UPI0013C50FB4